MEQMNRTYTLREPTGTVLCNGEKWFVFSTPVCVDSWQKTELQHTFMEAVSVNTFKTLPDGKKLYGKPVTLTVPINSYTLVQSDFDAIAVWTGRYSSEPMVK